MSLDIPIIGLLQKANNQGYSNLGITINTPNVDIIFIFMIVD